MVAQNFGKENAFARRPRSPFAGKPACRRMAGATLEVSMAEPVTIEIFSDYV
jgi:hypothetical protein